MRKRILGVVVGGVLAAGVAAPAFAQAPTVAATAPPPGAVAVVPVPGAAAVTAYMNGQLPAGQQVVPMQNGNGFSLVVTEQAAAPDQPSWVTNRPARSWFEAESFSSFASSEGPIP